MKKAIRNAMMILAGASMIFAAVGNAAADEVVNVGGAQISAADYYAIKARVAGEPAGDRVFAKKAEAVNIGGVELARADVDRVRAVVTGDASVADAAVYAQAPEEVNIGAVSMDKAEFEAIRAKVDGGPMVRLAQRIQDAVALN